MTNSQATARGAVGLIRPVTDFYARILGSPRLAHHFEGSAMEALIAKQAAYISAIVSGEVSYSRADIARVHARLNVSPKEYDEMISILKSTLDDHGVASDQQAVIVQSFEKFRSAVVRQPVGR